MEDITTKLKTYTKKELRYMYNVHPNTLSNWLRDIEPTLIKFGYNRNQKLLTIKQVEIIFARLGEP